MKTLLLAIGVLGTPLLIWGSAFGQVGGAGNLAHAQTTHAYSRDPAPGLVTFHTDEQGGAIGIFADYAGTNCNLMTPDAGVVMQLHVVHFDASGGATGCQFSAPKPECFNAVYLSDECQFPVVLGNTQTGIAVAYGACLTGRWHVVTMNYLISGTTPACCIYPLLPDPRDEWEQVVVSDCDFNVLSGEGRSGIVNSNADCPCETELDCPQPILTLQGYRSLAWEPPFWTVQVEVHNSGPGPAKHVSATMQQDIPWLGVLDPTCYYGSIPVGGSSWGGTDTYVFDLSSHPGGDFNVWFDVSYEDTCGQTRLVRLDPEFDIDGNPDPSADTTTRCGLGQNYPNPFNPTTTIPFFLPTDADVRLSIFDSRGKLVRVLFGGSMSAGSKEVTWDGRDANGTLVSSGLYLCQLKTPGTVQTRKLLLLK